MLAATKFDTRHKVLHAYCNLIAGQISRELLSLKLFTSFTRYTLFVKTHAPFMEVISHIVNILSSYVKWHVERVRMSLISCRSDAEFMLVMFECLSCTPRRSIFLSICDENPSFGIISYSKKSGKAGGQ